MAAGTVADIMAAAGTTGAVDIMAAGITAGLRIMAAAIMAASRITAGIMAVVITAGRRPIMGCIIPAITTAAVTALRTPGGAG